MELYTRNELVNESKVNVSAMAEIVHDLLAGGFSRTQDRQWLQRRTDEAGLSRYEQEALESRQVWLSEHGTAVLEITRMLVWKSD